MKVQWVPNPKPIHKTCVNGFYFDRKISFCLTTNWGDVPPDPVAEQRGSVSGSRPSLHGPEDAKWGLTENEKKGGKIER